MRNRCLTAGLALLFLLLSGCTVKVKQSENRPDTSDYLQVVTLSVAGVGLHQPDELQYDEKMLDAFEKSSGIRVNILRSAHSSRKDDYLDYLSLLEQSASLPDLLIFPSIPRIDEKHILIDLKKYVDGDEEYQRIPLPLRTAAAYSGSLPALPLRYYLEGYFVNRSVFQAQKLNAPGFGSSFSFFFSSVKALAAKKSGVTALGQFYEIPFWYPVIQQKKPTLWGAYADGTFSLTGQSFREGVSYASQLRAACYPDTEPDELPEETAASLLKKWKNGSLALYYGSTAELGEIKAVSFEVSFIGIPCDRPLLDADYIGITKSCTHPKEAFALLKWLSYGESGLAVRYAEESAADSGSPPINGDAALLKRFSDAVPARGIREAIDLVSSAIVQGGDYIPNYHTYMQQLQYELSCRPEIRQSAQQWIFDAVDGRGSFEQYASELERLINWRPEE